MIQQTTSLQFRFPKDVMNVMWWENTLVVNDEEENTIHVHGVPMHEIFYLMSNVSRKISKDIKPYHLERLKETYKNLGEYLEALKDEDNNED